MCIYISDSLRQHSRHKPLTKPNLTDSCRQAAVTSQLRIPSLTPSCEAFGRYAARMSQLRKSSSVVSQFH